MRVLQNLTGYLFERVPSVTVDAPNTTYTDDAIKATFAYRSTSVSVAPDGADWTDWKLVSNLPYNVASPLLVDLAAMPQGPRRLVITVQWEVGQRLAARAATRDYSKLTLLVGCRYEVQAMFKISPHCFFPEPRVDSACLTLDRRSEPLYPDALHKPFTTVVKRAFSQRRKMMRKNLKGGWPEGRLDAAMNTVQLDPKIRAEKVTLEQFVALTQELHDY